jgi:hypothetical protein
MTKAKDKQTKQYPGSNAPHKTEMEIDSANDRSELAQDESETTLKSHEFTPEVMQAIRLRAYELFEQRGKVHGHDWDDWLQAEEEFTIPGVFLQRQREAA